MMADVLTGSEVYVDVPQGTFKHPEYGVTDETALPSSPFLGLVHWDRWPYPRCRLAIRFTGEYSSSPDEEDWITKSLNPPGQTLEPDEARALMHYASCVRDGIPCPKPAVMLRPKPDDLMTALSLLCQGYILMLAASNSPEWRRFEEERGALLARIGWNTLQELMACKETVRKRLARRSRVVRRALTWRTAIGPVGAEGAPAGACGLSIATQLAADELGCPPRELPGPVVALLECIFGDTEVGPSDLVGSALEVIADAHGIAVPAGKTRPSFQAFPKKICVFGDSATARSWRQVLGLFLPEGACSVYAMSECGSGVLHEVSPDCGAVLCVSSRREMGDARLLWEGFFRIRALDHWRGPVLLLGGEQAVQELRSTGFFASDAYQRATPSNSRLSEMVVLVSSVRPCSEITWGEQDCEFYSAFFSPDAVQSAWHLLREAERALASGGDAFGAIGKLCRMMSNKPYNRFIGHRHLREVEAIVDRLGILMSRPDASRSTSDAVRIAVEQMREIMLERIPRLGG